MSVIIRLQGLPWSASAMNIRHFFAGLNIPAGGVHIIGGEGGDAFIAFSSDDDARVAMKKNLCPLNGSPVQLFLSSKSEMQSVIDAARSGGTAPLTAPTGNIPQSNQQQPLQQQQQPRQQFPNMPGTFPMENQGQSNMSGGFVGNMNEYNQQMQNKFPKNDWQGFQMYGGEEQSQQIPNQIPQSQIPQNQIPQNQMLQNQRMSVQQMDGRFPTLQGDNERVAFGGTQQQVKGYQDVTSQYMDSNGQMQQTMPAAMGMGSFNQEMNIPSQNVAPQKQPLFGDQMGVRPGNVPATPAIGDNQAAMMGNFGGMGRGQNTFPGQVNAGPNRTMFNANLGRSFPGMPGNEVPGEIPGNRSLLGDGIQGRTEEYLDESLRGNKFTNQFTNEHSQLGPDIRKAEMMDWSAESQTDLRFAGGQNMYDQEIQGDKPTVNREKMLGADGRPFQQFPFRSELERTRMNRGPDVGDRGDVLMDPAANRLIDRSDREPAFPGRDVRMGGSFPPTQEPDGRYPTDKFADRPVNRFSSDRLPPEENLPSTRYPPDIEQDEPEEDRPIGRFPPIRGRPDELRYPSGDRQFPPDNSFASDSRRMPNRDSSFPSEQERFPEGGRKFPPSGRGFLPDESRFPAGLESRRFPPEDGRFPTEDGRFPTEDGRFPQDDRFPPEERMGLRPDRSRADEFGGRRPVDNPFAPEDVRLREREEELRRRDPFGRGRRAMDDRFARDEGRPDIRPGFGDFEEGEEGRRFPPERRIPPERGFRGEKAEEEYRDKPPVLGERRRGPSRWDRERFDDWQEGDERFPPARPPRGPLADNPDFPGAGRPGSVDVEGPMDMDQRSGRDLMPGRGPQDGRRGPLFEGRGVHGLDESRALKDPDGLRGPGMEGFRAQLHEGRGGHLIEGMRGRGVEGMRGRGIEGMRGRGGPAGLDGRRGPGIPSLMDDNSFDYSHGSMGRGRPLAGTGEEEEQFGEPLDYDSRFEGLGGRGGLFDRPPRGRGEAFFNRVRPGVPLGRGRGLDVDRRFEDAGPESRFNLDVDARNVGGRPDGPPLRQPLLGDSKLPDFSVKPGSGKGLLGDAPPMDKPTIQKPEETKDGGDTLRRDIDNRSTRRSSERDRDHRSSDRRGRDREDRRSGERSRYRYERDRSDRRRSRSRDRSSRDKEGRRSRDRSTSTKNEGSRSDIKGETKKRSILIKNISPSSTYKDVRRFLQPLEIPFDGLKIINDKQGQKTGEAFVQFRYPEDAMRAVRRNGERLNGKNVTISLCTDEEFSAAVDSASPTKKDTPNLTENQKTDKDDKIRYIVQLKNLPASITKQDVVQFFKGLTIENNGDAVYLEYDQSGVATGNGFAEFKSDYDYKKALTQDGGSLGTVAIRVFPGKKEEAEDLKLKQQDMLQRAALRNVSGSRIIQPPRPQGQAPRPQGQQRPQGPPQLQGQPRPQGPQRPLLQPPQPALMGLRPGMGPQQPGPAAQPGPGNQGPRAPAPAENTDTVCVHIQGLPLLATPQDIREFFSDCQIALRGINIAHDSRGKPLGEGFVEFKFKSDFEKAIKKDKTSLGRHIVAVKPIGKKEMIERLENARGLPVQQGLQQSQNPPVDDQNKIQGPAQPNDKQQLPPQQGPPPGQNPQGPKTLLPGQTPPQGGPGVPITPGGSKSIPPGVLNKNWYYVRCQNFPPDISISEILGFFQGFRPIGESIRLHYSNEGKPTGNAVVGFGSLDEAQRALQRLNMKMCRQNMVTLHPA